MTTTARERALISSNHALLARNTGLQNNVQALQAEGAHKDDKTRHLAMQVCAILKSYPTHFVGPPNTITYYLHYQVTSSHHSVNSVSRSKVTCSISF